MLLLLVAASPLGHSIIWPTGVYVVPEGTQDYDRIVVLAPGEKVTLPHVPTFAATPVFKTMNEVKFKEDLYSAVCAGSDDLVSPDDTVPVTPIFRTHEQVAGFAPWRLGENYTNCVGEATLTNKGNTRFLLFLGGRNDQQRIADYLAQGGHNIWFHAEWNDEAWTFPTFVVLSCLLVAAAFYPAAGPRIMASKPRFYLYVLAIAGFAAAAIEGITHTIISSNRLAAGGAGAAGSAAAAAVAIVLAPNIGAIAITLITMYSEWMESHYWGFAELGVGFAYMLFWIGLYVGPAAIMAAALVRIYQGRDAKLVEFSI